MSPDLPPKGDFGGRAEDGRAQLHKIDFLLAGIGGQGIILASDIIGETGIAAGYDVKKSDVMGMAQRGGGVVSHIRLGPEVFSPLVSPGQAEVILSFEKLEACRWISYLKRDGLVVVNNYALPPLSVTGGAAEYPADEEIRAILGSRTSRVHFLDGRSVAEQAGSVKANNVVALGFLSAFLEIELEAWLEGLRRCVPARVLDLNTRAFELGREEANKVGRG